jgi:hypothetical protein
VDPLPVGDDQAAEPDPVLEHVGDELAVGVHLDRVADAVLGPVDAGGGRHHAAHAVPAHGRDVGRQVDAGGVPPVGDGDALVDGVVALAGAALGVAVTGVVLGGGEHAVAVGQVPGAGPWKPSIAVSILMTSEGSSPKLS